MTELYSMSLPSRDLPDRAKERRVVSRQAVPLADLGCFPLGPYTRDCRAWLRASGDLVLAAAAESWLFLWIIDVGKAEVHTRVAWPLGEWLSSRFEIAFHHDTLWVIAHHNLIEISCQDWEIRSCRCFRDFLPVRAIVEQSLLVAGSSYLWVRTGQDIFIVDVETWKLHRHLGGIHSYLTPVTGPEPLIFLAPSDVASTLFRPDGLPVPGDLPIEDLVYSLARTPDGSGLMSLDLEENPDHEDLNDLVLRHLAAEDSGSFRCVDSLKRQVIGDGCHLGSYGIFVSRDHGLAYVVVHLNRHRRDKHLLAVSVSRRGGSLAVRYRAQVPYDLALVQDRRARRVVAIFTGERGLHVLPLGRERPSFDYLPARLFDRTPLWIPDTELDDPDACGNVYGDDQRLRSYPLAQHVDRMSPADRHDFMGHFKAAFHDDVEELVDLCHALEFAMYGTDAAVREGLERERDDVIRILHEEHAEDPAANLLIANREAQAGHWHEVRRRLRVARHGDFQDYRKGHVLHLEGIALVQMGRTDEAFKVFSRARSYGRALCDCDLRDLELLTRPMADPPEVSEWDDDRPLLRQLVGAIRTAGRLRDSGDGEAALAALDRPLFWQTGEVQIAARRAEIFLKKSDGSAEVHPRFVPRVLPRSLDPQNDSLARRRLGSRPDQPNRRTGSRLAGNGRRLAPFLTGATDPRPQNPYEVRS